MAQYGIEALFADAGVGYVRHNLHRAAQHQGASACSHYGGSVCRYGLLSVPDAIHLPDEVITLERGAFSGCGKMTNIHLHNVSIISKTCFTNCNSLERVYCSDLVTYIGEWAFAHCTKLKEISVYKDCFIDNNATLNSNVNINIRKELSN